MGTPDASVTQLRLIDSDRLKQQQVGTGDTVKNAAAESVMNALILAEIAEPTRSKLAALPGITAELGTAVHSRGDGDAEGRGGRQIARPRQL